MLQGVSLYIATKGFDVTVVARDEQKLHGLRMEAAEKGANIRPRRLDYRVSPMFKSKIMDDCRIAGPIELAVTWIHSDAPEAPAIVADVIAMGKKRCRMFDVLGSQQYDPTSFKKDRADAFCAYDTIDYHAVYLGFMLTGTCSRWLTNDEIAAGVITAIETDARETTVGVTMPWEMHP